MSVDSSQSDARPQTCTPCRGTGKVISNLGGERREVTCPWCEGSGDFRPGHDAQGDAPPPPQTAPGETGDAESAQ